MEDEQMLEIEKKLPESAGDEDEEDESTDGK
jgi:hypothetical protein